MSFRTANGKWIMNSGADVDIGAARRPVAPISRRAPGCRTFVGAVHDHYGVRALSGTDDPSTTAPKVFGNSCQYFICSIFHFRPCKQMTGVQVRPGCRYNRRGAVAECNLVDHRFRRQTDQDGDAEQVRGARS